MNKSLDKNVEPIDKKKRQKEDAERLAKDYLKPSCDEEVSEEEYPTIKGKEMSDLEEVIKRFNKLLIVF